MTDKFNFKLYQEGIAKSGDSFNQLNDTKTDYQFIVRSNPIDDSEKIFAVITTTTWTFENDNSILYGCSVTFLPTSYGIDNPTLDNFIGFAHKAVEEINKNLTEQLKGTGLPPDLKIQSLHPDKNYPLLSIAVQSWQSLN